MGSVYTPVTSKIPDEEYIQTSRCPIKNKWGWVVTMTSLVLITGITGILSSSGVIYVKSQREFGISDLKAALIASVAFAFYNVVTPLSTWLFSRFGHMKVAMAGILLCISSLISSSFVPTANYLFFTYSILYGSGTCFVEMTLVNLIVTYFPRKNCAKATGIATCGWSIGILVMNPFVEAMCEAVGWRRFFQIFAAGLTIFALPLTFVFRPAPVRCEEGKETKVLTVGAHHTFGEYFRRNLRVTKIPGFLLWLLFKFFLNISVHLPTVSLLKFMTTIDIPDSQGAFVLTVMGVADLCGRLSSSLYGDYLPFRSLYVLSMASGMMGIATFSLLFVYQRKGMFIFAALFGFASGSRNAILPKVMIDVFGIAFLPEMWAFSVFVSGIGIVMGPPIAGAIYDNSGSFGTAFIIGGGTFLFATLISLLIPPWQRHHKWQPSRAEKLSKTRVFEKTSVSKSEHVINGDIERDTEKKPMTEDVAR